MEVTELLGDLREDEDGGRLLVSVGGLEGAKTQNMVKAQVNTTRTVKRSGRGLNLWCDDCWSIGVLFLTGRCMHTDM